MEELRLVPTPEHAAAVEPVAPTPEPQPRSPRHRSVGDDPIGRLIVSALKDAVDKGASDLLFEPSERGLVLRLRIDGHAQATIDGTTNPTDLERTVTSRLKTMADLVITDGPGRQTGSFSVLVDGRPVFVRCTVVPTAHGDAVALRVVDGSAPPPSVDALGLPQDAVVSFLGALSLPSGLVVVAGPPGSGKTTTAYAALSQLFAPERVIVTLEDPAEVDLLGIDQVAVNGRDRPTVADALQSALRANPEVLFVGEIRDAETARAAVDAASSGVLVLSTTLAKDAAAAVARIADHGVPRERLAAALRCVLAQRLTRKLCAHCRSEAAPDEGARAFIAAADGGPVPLVLHRRHGCPACEQTGYKGRALYGELLTFDRELRSVVASGSSDELVAAAAARGVKTLAADGMRLVRSGATTLDEIVRTGGDLLW
ncbi:MAG TPA: ATPase, T2SS/T4P/T4SS family [Gaiellaceae bacterium]|nr:ATPase, T2SS/T4P/T4SS family [Gaiellaceae bacterium]